MGSAAQGPMVRRLTAEGDGFELVVPDLGETFLLYRLRAANWPGATPGFDDR